MALTVENIKRTFVYEKDNSEPIKLADIPGLTPEQTLEHYAALYPELTTGVVQGPFQKAKAVEYKFVTKLGTKG